MQGLFAFAMRYHYELKGHWKETYGRFYICDHPVYSTCTLYEIEGKGLAVIQERFDKERKVYSWGAIDARLVDDIYKAKKFKEFFNKFSDWPKDGLYPTVTVRQIMWALGMKPLKREAWETTFDHKPI